MGQMEFKMERTGLLEVGDVLPIKEYEVGNSYYYLLGRSYAMSANYSTLERIDAKEANPRLTQYEELALQCLTESGCIESTHIITKH